VDAVLDDEELVRDWRQKELRRLGFTQKQRTHLLDLIEAGDLNLEQVRHPIDDLGWTAEQTWWAVC
jgi:hypothetical protein